MNVYFLDLLETKIKETGWRSDRYTVSRLVAIRPDSKREDGLLVQPCPYLLELFTVRPTTPSP